MSQGSPNLWDPKGSISGLQLKQIACLKEHIERITADIQVVLGFAEVCIICSQGRGHLMKLRSGSGILAVRG